MPCGGIRLAYVPPKTIKDYPYIDVRCWVCGKPCIGDCSFWDEWYAYLHDECVDKFLKSEEGALMLSHGHEVERR